MPLKLGDREVRLDQLGGDVLAAVRLVHGDVHEVPDVHEHVGDEVADDPPADLADEGDARLAGQLAAEDGQRPRQRERAALDGGHGLEVGELHGPHDALAARLVGDGLERHARRRSSRRLPGAGPASRVGARP